SMALRDQSGGLFKLAVLLERRSPGRRIRRAPHRAELELGAPVHGEPPFVRAHALGPLNPPPTPPGVASSPPGRGQAWVCRPQVHGERRRAISLLVGPSPFTPDSPAVRCGVSQAA